MRRTLLANAALSVVTTVVFLGALEGGARVVERRRPPKPRPEVADYIWDWDDKMPGGFYVMKSDAAGWPPWEEFNGDGLRDRTRPREKADGVRRVAILGDSVTFGAGIRPDEAFPQVLEARLVAQGRPLEVMNVALMGWSTRQERIAWQRIARAYQPDGAILAVCLNDIPELFNNLSRPPRWLTALHERSALVRLLVDAEGREIDSVERLFAEPDSPRVTAALAGFFEEVRALRRDVEQDGARLSVVVFPFRFQVEASAPAPVVQRKIAAFCHDEGLRCLDLLPLLAAEGTGAFFDYDHLSARGAALTADALLGSGLLPDAEAAPAALARALASDHGPGAADAGAWLSKRGRPLAPEGLRAIEGLLTAGEAGTRWAAAWALAAAGAGAVPARGALEHALEHDASSGVRAQAAVALAALGGRAGVPALFAALGDPAPAVRHEAARSLARLAPTTEDVTPLVAALASRDDYVAAFAAWSLGNLGPGAHGAVPALAGALSRARTDAVVAGALARIGPAASGAVPVLVEALRSSDADRRWRAARTLGRIGPAAAGAVEPISEALRDENGAVRLHAARALGRIGPAARPAAAALQRATGDADEGVRQEARQALDRLH